MDITESNTSGWLSPVKYRIGTSPNAIIMYRCQIHSSPSHRLPQFNKTHRSFIIHLFLFFGGVKKKQISDVWQRLNLIKVVLLSSLMILGMRVPGTFVKESLTSQRNGNYTSTSLWPFLRPGVMFMLLTLITCSVSLRAHIQTHAFFIFR